MLPRQRNGAFNRTLLYKLLSNNAVDAVALSEIVELKLQNADLEPQIADSKLQNLESKLNNVDSKLENIDAKL